MDMAQQSANQSGHMIVVDRQSAFAGRYSANGTPAVLRFQHGFILRVADTKRALQIILAIARPQIRLAFLVGSTVLRLTTFIRALSAFVRQSITASFLGSKLSRVFDDLACRAIFRRNVGQPLLGNVLSRLVVAIFTPPCSVVRRVLAVAESVERFLDLADHASLNKPLSHALKFGLMSQSRLSATGAFSTNRAQTIGRPFTSGKLGRWFYGLTGRAFFFGHRVATGKQALANAYFTPVSETITAAPNFREPSDGHRHQTRCTSLMADERPVPTRRPFAGQSLTPDYVLRACSTVRAKTVFGGLVGVIVRRRLSFPAAWARLFGYNNFGQGVNLHPLGFILARPAQVLKHLCGSPCIISELGAI